MSSALASAGVLTGFEAIAEASAAPFQFENKLSLKILGTNWGFEGTTDAFCAAVKKEGYDGIEIWWPDTRDKQNELFTALKKHGLEVGFLCGSGETDYAVHLDAFKKSITAATTEYVQKPLYVNCHSGRDHFTYDQNKAFIDHTSEATEKTGIPIYHETHRGRMLFAAHITRNFIEKNPQLRLTLDISHWCNVHESLLTDQQETVKLALSRVGHIHSRIGHEEGPQVNDPRAPEWDATVKAHLAWWDAVVEQKVKSGETLTVLTEFGPPHYLPTVPFTNQPLADQWAINVHMMQMLRKRYLK
ncbi:sugar phosphate isomerase/epimerase [Dyadobacter arcticus]|uniref:Sugar phosphate isomerase/epimerase n=2 Tax=Dyadobacter arcticus TaxID=1078754 RepID=A0ABX0UD39_9BACT|nr:sugar phosphate isomerase/epimerase [Dyadobacter arcticus]